MELIVNEIVSLQPPAPPAFPCLMSMVPPAHSGLVVLRTGPSSGVVLRANSGYGWEVGEHSGSFSFGRNDGAWELFRGDVTLRNDE